MENENNKPKNLDEQRKERKRKRNREYCKENKEKRAAYSRQYRKDHPKTEEQKKADSEYQKEYRLKNREKLIAYKKQWDAENPDWLEKYYEEHPEKKEEHLQRNKEWREANPERRKQLWKEWYKLNPTRSAKRRFTEARSKAIKKRKLTWTLTLEEYTELIQQPCHYCNNELGVLSKRAVGLDRLDNSRGYEIDNVVSCCFVCNCIKNAHFTPEETKVAVDAVIAFRKSKLPSTT